MRFVGLLWVWVFPYVRLKWESLPMKVDGSNFGTVSQYSVFPSTGTTQSGKYKVSYIVRQSCVRQLEFIGLCGANGRKLLFSADFCTGSTLPQYVYTKVSSKAFGAAETECSWKQWVAGPLLCRPAASCTGLFAPKGRHATSGTYTVQTCPVPGNDASLFAPAVAAVQQFVFFCEEDDDNVGKATQWCLVDKDRCVVVCTRLYKDTRKCKVDVFVVEM